METVRVTFETITPLWTGDAWRENREIRPSSLLGSLRFWFEVICYFAGITNENDYENGKLKADLNIENFNKFILGKIKKGNPNNFHLVDMALAAGGIPLPARIFGCTGWSGWIRVKRILNIKKREDYNYCLNKIKIRDLKYKKGDKAIVPAWYFKKGFWGKFEIEFEVEESIIGHILLPLFIFMNQYGFWGGYWNLGYGRLKINLDGKLSPDLKFNFSEFNPDNHKNFIDREIDEIVITNNGLKLKSPTYEYLKFFFNVDNFFCNKEIHFSRKTKKLPKKIRIVENLIENESTIEVIKELLKTKAEMRNCLRPNHDVSEKLMWHYFRHELLGTTSGGTEGTKILPWIAEENGKLRGGLISIAGLLNLEGKNGTKKKND